MKKLNYQPDYTRYFGLCGIVGAMCLLVWIAFAWPTFAAFQKGQESPWPLPFVVACALLGLAVFFITQQRLKAYLTTSFTTQGLKQCNLWRCHEIFWGDIVLVEVKYEGNDPCLRPLQVKFASSAQRIYVTLAFFKHPEDLLAQVHELVPPNTFAIYDPYNPTDKVNKILSSPQCWWIAVILGAFGGFYIDRAFFGYYCSALIIYQLSLLIFRRTRQRRHGH